LDGESFLSSEWPRSLNSPSTTTLLKLTLPLSVLTYASTKSTLLTMPSRSPIERESSTRLIQLSTWTTPKTPLEKKVPFTCMLITDLNP
jgi:hypothetical protein